jgi:hypothetical protein
MVAEFPLEFDETPEGFSFGYHAPHNEVSVNYVPGKKFYINFDSAKRVYIQTLDHY